MTLNIHSSIRRLFHGSVRTGVMTSINLLDEIEDSVNFGAVVREPARTILVGSHQPWAYAASIRTEGTGAATLKAWVKLTSGSMSIGLLSKDEKSFVSDLVIPIT